MFFKNKQNEVAPDNHIVALDIGTEYVKALIAEIDGDDIKVVGVGRAHQEISDMHSGAIADIASVVKNCEDALIEAEDQAQIQAKRAVVGIAGELVKGATNTIRYRRPQPNRPLDEAEMEFIIDKIHERAQLKAQREIALETGNKEAEIKLVNSAIVGIHIDGYKVSNPIGFQGKDVAIQIYTAFAPTVHLGAIERVANELALDLIAIAAEPFAVARSVIGTDSASNFTAILADVGGGTTDIAVVTTVVLKAQKCSESVVEALLIKSPTKWDFLIKMPKNSNLILKTISLIQKSAKRQWRRLREHSMCGFLVSNWR